MSEEENNQNQTAEEQVDQPDQPEQFNQPVELAKKWEFKPGAVILIGLAVVALAFILWLIYAIWSAPDLAPAPPAPVETEEYVDLTNVPGRDPAVLGLRIDTIIGRLFTEPITGRTLYFNDNNECVETCLEEWTPYLAEEPVTEEGAILSTTEREDGTFQYTWDGKSLYTYQLDNDDSVLGDGHSGTWHIARP